MGIVLNDGTIYRETYEKVWEDTLSDEQRRAVLDRLTDTSYIPSGVKWDSLDYDTRKAILVGDMVPGISLELKKPL